MPKKRSNKISRRDALKLGGIALAAAVLSCNRQTKGMDLPGSPATNSPSPTGMADLIMKGGKVFTVDPSNSIKDAIAIKDGLIHATGTDHDIEALAGASTQVIELKGRSVTPGFIDPHIHFRVWGLQNVYYIPFLPPDVKDIASLQRALADALKGRPEGEWTMCYYLGLADKTIPEKEDLDPVSSNHPVFLMHIGGHWATANSVALQIAKVTASTPSPEGGIIEKKDGELTGVLYNHRAMDVVRAYAPKIDGNLVKQAILETQKAFAACGVTSFHDNNIRDLNDILAYQELTQEGKLFLRNDLYLTLEWPSDIEKIDQVQVIQNNVTRFAGYKFLIDGQGPTAYCHEPHNGVEWRLPTWDPQMFKDTIRTLHDTGLQVCVHTIGDAAADLTLEAYEAAMNANPRSDPRHRIEHAILTTAQATQKMKDLGVVVSTQPAFIYLFGEGWEGLFGTERMKRILVTREWMEAGVHVAIGSDAPSTPLYNPAATLAGAMSRVTIKQKPIGADQIMTFEEALRAHTYEGAYASHQENVKGTLEAGKFADLVVWKDDPGKLRIGDLAQVKTVDMTMVGGRVVHQAS